MGYWSKERRNIHFSLYRSYLHYIVLFIFCSQLVGYAQHHNITFKHLSTTDGLSNFTVLSIAQDHQGFMWFGTMDGLNRYDGKDIKIYREDPDDPNSLGNNYIYDLQVTSDSGIWVGTNGGLYYYDYKYDSFKAIPLINRNGDKRNGISIRSFYHDGDLLWIGTAQGLFHYDLVHEKFIYPDELGGNSQRPNEVIYSIKKSKEGTIWIGHNNGLTKFRDKVYSDISYTTNETQIKGSQAFAVISIEIDSFDRLWLGTADLQSGLIVYDPRSGKKVALSKQDDHLPHNRVNCLSRFNDEIIWAGTTWGLALINERTFESKHYFYENQNPASLSQNSIKEIFMSNDELIWLGTYSGGVNYFDKRTQLINHVTDRYNDDRSLNFNIVSSIFQDRNENLWIGTEYGGINIFNSVKQRFSVIRDEGSKISLISDNIKCIVEDHKGRLFIATQFGLSIYNPANASFFNINRNIGPRGRLNANIVHNLCIDHQNNIWIGTTGGANHFKMYNIQKDSVIHYFPEDRNFPTLNSILVNSMVFDPESKIVWAGGNNGLGGIHAVSKKHVSSEAFRPAAETLQATIINDLYLDENGLLWIATFGRGLFILNPHTFELRKIGKNEGLNESSFYAIQGDDDGNIWVSVSAYLLKIKPLEHIRGKIASIEKFGLQEGFPPQQYLRNSACKGNDGTLYFGGDDGYVSFNPREVENIVFNPEVSFLGIDVNGEELKLSSGADGHYLNVGSLSTLSLKYYESSFAVRFIAPNYISPENTWYQYQFSDLGDSWQDIGNANSINFTKLKAGNYTLKLRASSDPENWGSGFSQMKIEIDPPYWSTSWAYAMYIIIISVMLYVFFLISRKWERMEHNLKLEHFEREKEQDFHERRIRFFTDISHELRTPLTLILAPIERLIKSNLGNVKIKNQLMLMLRNGERMLQLVNQLLDLRKLETGHMQLKIAKGDITHFIREVLLSFREMAESRDIDFKFKSDKEKVNVWFDRDKFEIILFNLLSNALKFTPESGKITIDVHEHVNSKKETNLQENLIAIEISNTGRGIPDDQIDHVFERFYTGDKGNSNKNHGSGVGLEIVKKLIDLHHGIIEVQSTYDEKGEIGVTNFKILLKKGSAHFDDKLLLSEYTSSEDIRGYKTAIADESINSSAASTTRIDGEGIEHEHTILIVEDNLEVRKLIVDIFQREYNVMEGENGKQGLELAHEKIPDLIITDVMMPEIDGIELCRRLKNNIVTSHIPVIILTARTAVTFKYEGLETGADDYIIKPFNVEDLKVRSKNLIRQRQLLKERFTTDSSFLPSDITITSVDDKLMLKVKEFIIENIGTEHLKVEKIAEEVGMSRANFYRKIKALTNMSAADFLKKIKMDHAAQLLKTNKFRVSEVQSIIGISDPDYFRKCFKAQFGMTPRDYIETNKK